MHKLFYILASILGFLAVSIGAFGAHGLKKTLEKFEKVSTFETGVQYHFYHTFALFIVAFLISQNSSKLLEYSGWSFILGIIIFSGSLYVLSLTNMTKLGMITPIGGLFFLAGWCLIAYNFIKN